MITEVANIDQILDQRPHVRDMAKHAGGKVRQAACDVIQLTDDRHECIVILALCAAVLAQGALHYSCSKGVDRETRLEVLDGICDVIREAVRQMQDD